MNPSLFTPTTLQNRELKNCVIAAPPPSLLAAADGRVTSELLDYYQNLASTGVGMLIVEATAVSAEGRAWPNQTAIFDHDSLNGFSRLTEKIRLHGALPVIQLYHGGMNSIPGPGHTVYSASSLRHSKINAVIAEMKPDKIDKTISDYVQAAKSAWNTGFSGIHLQAAEGSLPHQFLSPITNLRRDDYCFAENSGALFLQELITAVKSAVPDLVLIVSLPLRDLLPGGAGLKDAIQVARTLKKNRHDLIMISEGLKIGQPLLQHPSLDKSAADAPYAEDAHIFRNETGCRVIMAGKVGTPHTALSLLKRQTCDFIAVGRTLNREPLWLADHYDNKLLPWQHCLRCPICRAATSGCPDQKGVNHWHLLSSI